MKKSDKLNILGAGFIIGILVGVSMGYVLFHYTSDKYGNFNDVAADKGVSVSYPEDEEKKLFGDMLEIEINKFCEELTDEIMLLKSMDSFKNGNIDELIEHVSRNNAILVAMKENMDDKKWEYLIDNLEVAFYEGGMKYSKAGAEKLELDYDNMPEKVKKKIKKRIESRE